jgi:hypothetical protein
MIVICLTVTGCGGKGFVPAGGTVKYDDGSPVTTGGIAFQASDFMADGKINPDGSFTLSSLKPGDGLPPGTYKVMVSASETDDKEQTISLVDPSFGSVGTTTLSAEVSKGGKNQFDFVVTKPK